MEMDELRGGDSSWPLAGIISRDSFNLRRTYSFYIETSINQRNWEMVVDNRKENQRSWQQFYFKARPVVFIKIVGTNNTANEVS